MHPAQDPAKHKQIAFEWLGNEAFTWSQLWHLGGNGFLTITDATRRYVPDDKLNLTESGTCWSGQALQVCIRTMKQ